ncbi:MAG: hypothetical protein GYA58_03300 [Anaerolineaceae bacterium]|nr:hypothetical protein [Anaerolineaceae bacterium]
MTTHGKLTLNGLEEYLEEIAQAGRDVDEAAARALLAGAEVLEEGMEKRVPVDIGNLRNHIKIKGPEQEGNFIFIEVGVIHDKAFTDAETARYGNVIEYGSASKKGKDAQPYIRPTLAEDKGKARQAMKESLEQDGIL